MIIPIVRQRRLPIVQCITINTLQLHQGAQGRGRHGEHRQAQYCNQGRGPHFQCVDIGNRRNRNAGALVSGLPAHSLVAGVPRGECLAAARAVAVGWRWCGGASFGSTSWISGRTVQAGVICSAETPRGMHHGISWQEHVASQMTGSILVRAAQARGGFGPVPATAAPTQADSYGRFRCQPRTSLATPFSPRRSCRHSLPASPTHFSGFRTRCTSSITTAVGVWAGRSEPAQAACTRTGVGAPSMPGLAETGLPRPKPQYTTTALSTHLWPGPCSSSTGTWHGCRSARPEWRAQTSAPCAGVAVRKQARARRQETAAGTAP